MQEGPKFCSQTGGIMSVLVIKCKALGARLRGGDIDLLFKTEGGKAIPHSLLLYSFQQPPSRLKRHDPQMQ